MNASFIKDKYTMSRINRASYDFDKQIDRSIRQKSFNATADYSPNKSSIIYDKMIEGHS